MGNIQAAQARVSYASPLGTQGDPYGVATIWGVFRRQPVTDGFQQLLEYGTGRPMGIARAPVIGGDANAVPPVPYGVIYPRMGGVFTGSHFGLPDSEVRVEYQVTSVGDEDQQVEWLADHVRQSVLGRHLDGSFVIPMTVIGMAVLTREPTGPPGGMTRRDNIYSVVESYDIWVSAAPI